MKLTNLESWPVSWHLLSHRLLWREAIRISLLSTILKCPQWGRSQGVGGGFASRMCTSFQTEVMKESSEWGGMAPVRLFPVQVTHL